MDEPMSGNNDFGTFEREKWETSERRLSQELFLKERELAFREAEARRARYWNPLAIAILGASIAAAGSAVVSWENSKASLEVEDFKAESARIFEVVRTGNADDAAKNLNFLLNTGLIKNSSTVTSLRRYLASRKAGEGVALPSSSNNRDSYCQIPSTNVAPAFVVPCNSSISEVEQFRERQMLGYGGPLPLYVPHEDAADRQQEVDQKPH